MYKIEAYPGIGIIPLPNDTTLSYLRTYNSFLKTLFMKKLTSFTSIGGYSDLISANALEKIELTDEICVMITVIINKLPCFSVYSGLVMSSFLMKLWGEPFHRYGAHEIVHALNELQQILARSLEDMKIETRSHNVNYLQSLVMSVLKGEPSVCLEETSVRLLSLEIVKAVLSVTETENDLRFGFVGVHASQGKDNFFTVNGVLCEVDDLNVNLFKTHFLDSSSGYKVLLFFENLDIHDDLFIENSIIKHNVKLVFGQKKISDYCKMSLRRKRVLYLERLGEDTALNVQNLTGALPITDLRNLSEGDIPTAIGHCSNIRLITQGLKNLFVIENSGSKVVNLCIRCRSFTDISLIKKSVSDCIHMIKSVLSSPHYLPGPGVFEKSLGSTLNDSQTGKCGAVGEIIAIFVDILLDIEKLYRVDESREPDNFNVSYMLKRNAMLQAVSGVTNIVSLSHVIRNTV